VAEGYLLLCSGYSVSGHYLEHIVAWLGCLAILVVCKIALASSTVSHQWTGLQAHRGCPMARVTISHCMPWTSPLLQFVNHWLASSNVGDASCIRMVITFLCLSTSLCWHLGVPVFRGALKQLGTM
jgi:hypothetical protein